MYFLMELLSPAMQLRMIRHVRAFLLQKSDDKVKRANTPNNRWNVRRSNLMEVFLEWINMKYAYYLPAWIS